MIKKRRFGLMGQINIVFTTVSLITSILFVIIFRQTLTTVTKKQADKDFVTFSQGLSRLFANWNEERSWSAVNPYYGYVVFEYEDDLVGLPIYNNLDDQDDVSLNEVNHFITKHHRLIEKYIESPQIIDEGKLDYYFLKIRRDNNEYLLVTINNNLFEARLKEPINNIVLIGFLAIIILGNAIILMWTSIIVERIKNLKGEISLLSTTSYKEPVRVEGNDEITDLSKEINKMRNEIVTNEQTKQEMLQNLSHDIKTPIAVIKSYAEAIKDGVTQVDDIDVIIKQTDILTSKVFKLLEWNRLEYIEGKEEIYPVNLNKIIRTIANNFKFKSELEFTLDLDNSYIEGLDDYFYTMISNIVENAVRYAKSQINITLKNKKITIFNDGDPIDDKFLNNDFRPYKKGYKGHFGLGLSIVSRTAEHFNLKVSVENINNGVMFTIEPL